MNFDAFLYGVIRIGDYSLAGVEPGKYLDLTAVVATDNDPLKMHCIAGIEHGYHRSLGADGKGIAGNQHRRVFARTCRSTFTYMPGNSLPSGLGT